MCRFALYLGPAIRLSELVTDPANSIIHQSYDAKEREEPLNGDGFGVAWYASELQPEPAVFKDVSPAWNNYNLLNIAPVATSSCLLAHVRAATPGLPVSQLNCHPFVRHRLAFMHNGTIGGFRQLRRTMQAALSDHAYQAIQGSTDSENLLGLISDLHDQSVAEEPLERMAAATTAAIGQVERWRTEQGIEEQSYLNLALTDGDSAVASRFISDGTERAHSLYYASGRLVVERGEGRVVADGGEPAVIIASEPLGPDTRWTKVPPNHLVLVAPDRSVELRAI